MEYPETPGRECLHKYSRNPDGALVCSKCGSSITGSGAPLPESSNFCLSCKAEVEPENVICTSCGAPLEKIIKRRAMLTGADVRRCSHDYRYIEDGKICLKCAKTVSLKTPMERRRYAAALGKNICVYCGDAQSEERDICLRCGRGYEEITPLQPDRAVYNPKEAAAHMKSTRQAAAAGGPRPAYGPDPQRNLLYGQTPLAAPPSPGVFETGGAVNDTPEKNTTMAVSKIENSDASSSVPINEVTASGCTGNSLKKVRLLKDANLEQGLAFLRGEEAVMREVVEGEEGEQSAGYLLFSERLQQVVKVPLSFVEPVETYNLIESQEEVTPESAVALDSSTPDTTSVTMDSEEEMAPGDWVSINRTIVVPSGTLFNEGDIVQIEQLGVAGDEPQQHLIIRSRLDSRNYRLKRSDCEPCEGPVEVEPEPSVQERRCSECGAMLGPKATFCNQCGAIAGLDQKRLCIFCHAEISPGAKFCKKCGSSQEAMPGEQELFPTPRVPMVAPAVALPAGMICPNCNSRNVGGGQRPSWVLVTIILVSIFLFPIGLLSLLLLGVKDPFFCADCGFSWKAQSF